MAGLIVLTGCGYLDKAMGKLGAVNVNHPQQKGKLAPKKYDMAEAQKIEESKDCPAVQIVPELALFNNFINLGKTADNSPLSNASILNINHSCFYKDGSLTVDLNLQFEIKQLEPKAIDSEMDNLSFSHPFFISIISPDGEILSKETFTLDFTYSAGHPNQITHKDIRKYVHMAGITDAKKYQIVAGFQLSKEQMLYNLTGSLTESKEQLEKDQTEKAQP